MPQVTIYLEPKLEAVARKAAKDARTSLSRWIATAVREKSENQWSPEFLALQGALKDFPTAEEIRATYHPDLPREPW